MNLIAGRHILTLLYFNTVRLTLLMKMMMLMGICGITESYFQISLSHIWEVFQRCMDLKAPDLVINHVQIVLSERQSLFWKIFSGSLKNPSQYFFRWGTHFYMSLFLSVCPSVGLFICQSVCPSVHLSIHLPIYPSICPSFHLSCTTSQKLYHVIIIFVTICKMMISLGVFSFFKNYDFSDYQGGKRTKNSPK